MIRNVNSFENCDTAADPYIVTDNYILVVLKQLFFI